MKLQTPYLTFPKEALMKKKNFELKTLKFFIVCSLLLQGPAFQASALALTTSSSSIKSSFAILHASSTVSILKDVSN